MSELTTPPVKMHRVSYGLAYTKNLGNFENVKVFVELSQDGTGHPDATMERVAKWVEDTLGERVAKVLDALED